MRYGELKRKLRKAGCYKTAEGGNHEKWYSPKTGNSFPVGRHDNQEVKSGTLQSILKQSGVR